MKIINNFNQRQTSSKQNIKFEGLIFDAQFFKNFKKEMTTAVKVDPKSNGWGGWLNEKMFQGRLFNNPIFTKEQNTELKKTFSAAGIKDIFLSPAENYQFMTDVNRMNTLHWVNGKSWKEAGQEVDFFNKTKELIKRTTQISQELKEKYITGYQKLKKGGAFRKNIKQFKQEITAALIQEVKKSSNPIHPNQI